MAGPRYRPGIAGRIGLTSWAAFVLLAAFGPALAPAG